MRIKLRRTLTFDSGFNCNERAIHKCLDWPMCIGQLTCSAEDLNVAVRIAAYAFEDEKEPIVGNWSLILMLK